MPIYGLQRLLSLFLLTLICLTAPLLAGPSDARRNICGKHLADVLKLLCNGKYKEPGAAGNQPQSMDEREMSLTEECCSKACSIPTMMQYCAVNPSMMDMLKAVGKLNQQESPKTSAPASPSASFGGMPSSEGTGGGSPRTGSGGGRMSLVNGVKLFDLSTLFENRIDNYEAIPYRQRRR